MKRSALAAALLAAAALCAAQGADEVGTGYGGAAAAFELSGSISGEASFSIENEDSVLAGLAPFAETGAVGTIDGKLRFSKGYEALGLLDFRFEDSAIIDSDDGSTVESPRFLINELYADLNFGDALFLRLGKQRLSWGAGYVLNPSDPINPPKDPTSSRSPREGVPAIKAELIGEAVSLMAFSAIHDELAELGYGGKLSTSALPNSDIALSAYWSPSQSWTAALNASFAPLYDFPGWDTIQVWIEGGAYGKPRYGSAPEGTNYAALAGLSAQIPGLRTMLLTEYYRLSEGLSAEDSAAAYSTPATAAALAARPGRVAGDYLFASINQPSITESGDPILDKIGLSGSCLVNLGDGSLYASGGLSLLFVDDASIDISADYFRGDAESEFGNLPATLTIGLKMTVFY